LLDTLSASPIVSNARVVSSRAGADGEREFAIILELKGVNAPGQLAAASQEHGAP
jgi:hypothetical protein